MRGLSRVSSIFNSILCQNMMTWESQESTHECPTKISRASLALYYYSKSQTRPPFFRQDVTLMDGAANLPFKERSHGI